MHRFRKYAWNARLNIANVLNHYHVVLLPHTVTGWTSRHVIGTTFDQQPRSYQLSNTIGF